MTYIKEMLKGKSQWEGEVPLRKCLWLFFLIALTSSFSSQANVFLQRVQHDLAMHSSQQQWPAFKQEIALWLPNKATELPACQQGLLIERSRLSKAPVSRVNYQISCQAPKWTLRAHAKVKVWLPVLHAKMDISAQQTLSQTNSFYQRVDISRLHHPFIVQPIATEHYIAKQYLGLKSKKRIRAGKIISPHQLTMPYLVSVGEEILIRTNVDNFSASMKGKALQSGKLGDKISVVKIVHHKKDCTPPSWKRGG